MVDIEQWRRAIGLASQGARKSPKWKQTETTVSQRSLALVVKIFVVAAALIVSGDVELNPGPGQTTRRVSRSSKPRTRNNPRTPRTSRALCPKVLMSSPPQIHSPVNPFNPYIEEAESTSLSMQEQEIAPLSDTPIPNERIPSMAEALNYSLSNETTTVTPLPVVTSPPQSPALCPQILMSSHPQILSPFNPFNSYIEEAESSTASQVSQSLRTSLSIQEQEIASLRDTVRLLKHENDSLKDELKKLKKTANKEKHHQPPKKATITHIQRNGHDLTEEKAAQEQPKSLDDAQYQRSESTLILGDSHARSMSSKVSDSTAVIHAGVPVEFFDTSVVKKYKKIVLMGGSNNVSRGDSVQTTLRKIEATVVAIRKANPTGDLYVQELFPRFDPCYDNWGRAKVIEKINLGLRGVVERNKAKLMLCPHFKRREFTTHGLHLNNEGKNTLGQSINRNVYGQDISNRENVNLPMYSEPTSFLGHQ